MTESRAWLVQAESDRRIADRLYNAAGPSTYCHVVAKCQQAVEKGIKAVVASLRDAGILSIEIGYRHDVARFITVLIFMPHASENRSIQNRIHRILDAATRQKIQELDRIAPRRPAPGGLHARNTEYPFQESAGNDWRAPAEEGAFAIRECDEYRVLTYKLVRECGMIISSLERAMP